MTQTIQDTESPGGRATIVARRPPRRARREWPHRLVPVLLILAGALVVVYPVGATYYNNYKQSEFARSYTTDIQGTEPTSLREQLERAARYNATLSPTLLRDPWAGRVAGSAPGRAPGTARQVEALPEYREYRTQLALFDSMARLRVPRIKVDLPVFHGTDDAVLNRGVGHFFGSSLPVGGAGTHAVLTAHSSLPEATLFDHLSDLRVGDLVYLDVYGRTLAYRVDRTTVVLPDDLSGLTAAPGRDDITLVTCTPYAVNSHRLLVRASRVPLEQAPPPTQTRLGFDWTVQSWMVPRLAGAALAVLLVLAMMVGWVRADRRRRRR